MSFDRGLIIERKPDGKIVVGEFEMSEGAEGGRRPDLGCFPTAEEALAFIQPTLEENPYEELVLIGFV